MITDFSDLNLATNIFIFAVGAAGIWIAGTLLAGYADEIARRTGLGHVLIGMFLLAGITFLPEIATTFTAAYAGDSPMAVTNLLGGIALQMVVLAVGDLVYSRLPLTYVVPDPALMLQGTLNTVLLSLVAVAIVTGLFLMGLAERRDRTVFRMGVDSFLVLVFYAVGMVLLYNL